MWITYDPTASFPQLPLAGRGIAERKRHTPPSGMASFRVDKGDLIHGFSTQEIENLYEVTAPDVLTAIPMDRANTKRAAWDRENTRIRARPVNAENRLKQIMARPDIGGIKTVAQAIQVAASDPDITGKLLFAVVQISRALFRDDALYPSDE